MRIVGFRPGEQCAGSRWINGHPFTQDDIQGPPTNPIPVANPYGGDTASPQEVADSLRMQFENSSGLRHSEYRLFIEFIAKN